MITSEEFRKGWLHFLICIKFDYTNLDAESTKFFIEAPIDIFKALDSVNKISENFHGDQK